MMPLKRLSDWFSYKFLNKLNVGIVLTNGELVPTYTRLGDACVDLRSAENIVIRKNEIAIVKTNMKIQYIPSGWMLRVANRSGLASRGIIVANSDGIVDENYRGVVGVVLINLSKEDYKVDVGNRIAQMYPEKVVKLNLYTQVDEVKTNRGALGFNSSGSN